MGRARSWRAATALAIGAVLVGSLTAAQAGPAGATPPGARVDVDSPTVPNPVITGPIQNGIRGGAYNRSRFPLTDGYVEQEFFFQGVARAADGTTAPYKSRILVRRPTDPRHFNGSVVLDWDNVTVPDDTDVGWLPLHLTMMKRGFVYVAVAAQELSIEASPTQRCSVTCDRECFDASVSGHRSRVAGCTTTSTTGPRRRASSRASCRSWPPRTASTASSSRSSGSTARAR